MKITSKNQIALYLEVHVTSRGTSFIKNEGKPEDQDLYLGLNERLKLFPHNLIGCVAGRQNFSEMAQIQCNLDFWGNFQDLARLKFAKNFRFNFFFLFKICI